MIRRTLELIHRTAKFLFQGNIRTKIVFVEGEDLLSQSDYKIEKNSFLNELVGNKILGFTAKDIFPTENLTNLKVSKLLLKSKNIDRATKFKPQQKEYTKILKQFIDSSKIPNGWKNGGLHYAGFIKEENEWCLPSWVWTNAAVVSYYYSIGDIISVISLSDILLKLQLPSGGWIVRNEFADSTIGVSPIIAPNDSAYIASNALLNAYKVSLDSKYLKSAEKCADWIMNEGHNDYLPMIGFDLMSNSWKKDVNIVDVGFTADLFCKLFSITRNRKYLDFAKLFIYKYIDLFYIGDGKFTTSINEKLEKGGGVFARGQAWALEGLIPYYKCTNDKEILVIINDVIKHLISKQQSSGGWLYNLRPDLLGWISGYDNKGTPVIAHAIMRCIEIIPDQKERIINSINQSINWCIKNTSKDGKSFGGIFSNNFEGAVVHSFYTSTAFVYSSCYLAQLLKERDDEK